MPTSRPIQPNCCASDRLTPKTIGLHMMLWLFLHQVLLVAQRRPQRIALPDRVVVDAAVLEHQHDIQRALVGDLDVDAVLLAPALENRLEGS